MNPWLIKFRDLITRHAHEHGTQYRTFGVFGLLTYPLFYYVSAHYSIMHDGNLLLRIVATLLCIPLALSDYWPSRWRAWLPTYWYFALLYCLPFFFTIIVLENRLVNPTFVISMPFLLLWLMLLVDSLSFIVLFTIGTILGFVTAHYILRIYITRTEYFVILFEYIIFFATTMYLLYRRTQIKEIQDKTRAIKPLAAGIAHEIRTPLASISAGANGVKQYLPILLDAYQQAKNHNLPVGVVRDIHLKQLNETLDKIVRETHYTNTIIDMMLMQVNHSAINASLYHNLSMKECVNEALDRYPFLADYRSKLVEWNDNNDFKFYGDKLLLVHVIFNLIKNATYFIAEVNRGKIYIWMEQAGKYNYLHFKDTGAGIPEATLNHIFKVFFTTLPNGSGIGLAFCKNVIESMGGKISCKSVYGEFTEFIMQFPAIKD